MSETLAGMPLQPGGPVFFDAILRPNRSLSPRAFGWLMGITAATAFTIGTIFWAAGAWPVFGFCGLEFVALYFAFRFNYRAGRAYERVRLSDGGLEIERFGPRGQTGHWQFEPTWLQVRMDDPPQHDSKLTLASHGRSLTIGSFLTPEERLEVAEALREAIRAYREPRHAR